MRLFLIPRDTLTVIMVYISSTNLVSKLGIALTTEQSAYFAAILSPAIDAYIDKQTGTTFGGTTPTTIYLDGDDTLLLTLPTMHTITAVKDDTDTVIVSTAYSLYPKGSGTTGDKLAIRGISEWTKGNENYSVIGILGYQDVPADIKLVALELVTNALTEITSGLKSESVGDWSVSYDTAVKNISPLSVGILEGYTRLSRRI